MEQLFRQIRQLIAEKDFETLAQLQITKPEKFNWAKEVFEAIHVKDAPDATALLWTDGSDVRTYSFREVNELSNRLLNFLEDKNTVRSVADANIAATH